MDHKLTTTTPTTPYFKPVLFDQANKLHQEPRFSAVQREHLWQQIDNLTCLTFPRKRLLGWGSRGLTQNPWLCLKWLPILWVKAVDYIGNRVQFRTRPWLGAVEPWGSGLLGLTMPHHTWLGCCCLVTQSLGPRISMQSIRALNMVSAACDKL